MDEIREAFRQIGRQLGATIGESMLEAVREQLPQLRAELAGAASGAPVTRRASSLSRAQKVSLALTKECPVPGCGRPGRGPRFSFLCEVHRDLPKEEREKYRVRPRR